MKIVSKRFVSLSCFAALTLIGFAPSSSFAQETKPILALSSRYDPAVQKVEPFRIFDNLSYVGAEWVSAYVIETSDGLIVIDSLYGPFADHLLEGVEKLGLDPSEIKYVLCTHGHWDHMDGAARIQEVTGARVGMTEKDWRLVENGETLGERPRSRLNRDLVIKDGDVVTLGETTIRCYVTSGHTPGVLSMRFKVYDNGTPHTAFVFGGVGLNFEGVDRTRTYISSVKRLLAMNDLEVNITNHPPKGQIFERAKKLKSRKIGEPHPFVAPDQYKSFLKSQLALARVKLEEEQRRR